MAEEPTGPPGGDQSQSTFADIVKLTTGLVADFQKILDSGRGGGEGNGWIYLGKDLTSTGGDGDSEDSEGGEDTSGSLLYRYTAFDTVWVHIEQNISLQDDWRRQVEEMDEHIDRIRTGKAGLVDVMQVYNAKGALDQYVSWLDVANQSLQGWVAALTSDDSEFKGKAANVLRQQVSDFQYIVSDLREQIVDERKSQEELEKVGEELFFFLHKLTMIWDAVRDFLWAMPTMIINNIGDLVAAYMIMSGLVRNPGPDRDEPHRMYFLDDYSAGEAKEKIQSDISLFSTYKGNATASNWGPGSVAQGFKEISGPLNSATTWDTASRLVSEWLENEMGAMDQMARDALAKLEETYDGSRMSLRELEQPVTLGPAGGGGGAGGTGDLEDLFGGGGNDDLSNQDDITDNLEDLFGGGGNDDLSNQDDLPDNLEDLFGGGGNDDLSNQDDLPETLDDPFGAGNGGGPDDPAGGGGNGNNNLNMPDWMDDPLGSDTGGNGGGGNDPFGSGTGGGGNDPFGSGTGGGDGNDPFGSGNTGGNTGLNQPAWMDDPFGSGTGGNGGGPGVGPVPGLGGLGGGLGGTGGGPGGLNRPGSSSDPFGSGNTGGNTGLNRPAWMDDPFGSGTGGNGPGSNVGSGGTGVFKPPAGPNGNATPVFDRNGNQIPVDADGNLQLPLDQDGTAPPAFDANGNPVDLQQIDTIPPADDGNGRSTIPDLRGGDGDFPAGGMDEDRLRELLQNNGGGNLNDAGNDAGSSVDRPNIPDLTGGDTNVPGGGGGGGNNSPVPSLADLLDGNGGDTASGNATGGSDFPLGGGGSGNGLGGDGPGNGLGGNGPGNGSGGSGFAGEGWSDWSGAGENDQSGQGGGNGSGGQQPFMPPMMPPIMPPAGAQNNKDRERQTWLSEDEEVWGTRGSAVGGVIGLDGGPPVENEEQRAPTHVHVRSTTPGDKERGTAPAESTQSAEGTR